MIVPDVNLLVYAYNDDDHQRHIAARRWWTGLMDGTEPIRLPWIVISGFIRVTTHPGIMARPLTTERAVGNVRNWLGCDHIMPLNPGPEHLTLFQQNLEIAGVGAGLVPDAHVAALAMEHGAGVHSNDADFLPLPRFAMVQPSTMTDLTHDMA